MRTYLLLIGLTLSSTLLAQQGDYEVIVVDSPEAQLQSFGKMFFESFVNQDRAMLNSHFATEGELKQVIEKMTNKDFQTIVRSEYGSPNILDTLLMEFNTQFQTQYKRGIPDEYVSSIPMPDYATEVSQLEAWEDSVDIRTVWKVVDWEKCTYLGVSKRHIGNSPISCEVKFEYQSKPYIIQLTLINVDEKYKILDWGGLWKG